VSGHLYQHVCCKAGSATFRDGCFPPLSAFLPDQPPQAHRWQPVPLQKSGVRDMPDAHFRSHHTGKMERNQAFRRLSFCRPRAAVLCLRERMRKSSHSARRPIHCAGVPNLTNAPIRAGSFSSPAQCGHSVSIPVREGGLPVVQEEQFIARTRGRRKLNDPARSRKMSWYCRIVRATHRSRGERSR